MIPQHFDYFQYFDFSTAWNKTLKPIIESAPAKRMLERDFKIFVACKRNNYRTKMTQANLPFDVNAWKFEKGKLPADFDSCSWRYGKLPVWHQYVCHGACHYIANTLLYVAMVAYPNKAWRIVTSSKHSTIWDGELTLFDLNFVTLNIPVHECIEDAFMQSDTIVLNSWRIYEIDGVLNIVNVCCSATIIISRKLFLFYDVATHWMIDSVKAEAVFVIKD